MADMCPASSTLLIYIGSHVHFDALTKQSFLVANDTSRTQVSSSFVLYRRFSSALYRRFSSGLLHSGFKKFCAISQV
jgi:hypothetical protein